MYAAHTSEKPEQISRMHSALYLRLNIRPRKLAITQKCESRPRKHINDRNPSKRDDDKIQQVKSRPSRRKQASKRTKKQRRRSSGPWWCGCTIVSLALSLVPSRPWFLRPNNRREWPPSRRLGITTTTNNHGAPLVPRIPLHPPGSFNTTSEHYNNKDNDNDDYLDD